MKEADRDRLWSAAPTNIRAAIAAAQWLRNPSGLTLAPDVAFSQIPTDDQREWNIDSANIIRPAGYRKFGIFSKPLPATLKIYATDGGLLCSDIRPWGGLSSPLSEHSCAEYFAAGLEAAVIRLRCTADALPYLEPPEKWSIHESGLRIKPIVLSGAIVTVNFRWILWAILAPREPYQTHWTWLQKLQRRG